MENNNKLLSQLTLQGNYLGPDGAIRLARDIYREEKAKKNNHRWVPLASTYYSAAGHFRSVRRPVRAAFYLLLALRCVLLQLSRTSLYELSSSELDVCASVLRAARLRRRALRLVDEALSPQRSLSPDNRLLLVANRLQLRVSLGGIDDADASKASIDLYRGLMGAEGCPPLEASPLARVRGFRVLAAYYRQGGSKYRLYVELAIQICLDNNLPEPLKKVEAQFPEFYRS